MGTKNSIDWHRERPKSVINTTRMSLDSLFQYLSECRIYETFVNPFASIPHDIIIAGILRHRGMDIMIEPKCPICGHDLECQAAYDETQTYRHNCMTTKKQVGKELIEGCGLYAIWSEGDDVEEFIGFHRLKSDRVDEKLKERGKIVEEAKAMYHDPQCKFLVDAVRDNFRDKSAMGALRDFLEERDLYPIMVEGLKRYIVR
jgi:hypothetical protein